MAEAVYLLCGLASVACALLLFRGFRRSRARLLLWSSLCFAGLAVNNIVLFVDVIVLGSAADLADLRSWSALTAIGLMLYGLVWDSK